MSASLKVSLANPSALKLVLSSTSVVGALWQLVVSSALDRYQRIWLCTITFILLLGRLSLGQPWGSQKQNADLGFGRHPVDAIVTQAQAQFSMVLARQSRTLGEATVEYFRRYGRQPPPHFDEWFKLAQQHEFWLVDEFDSLMRSLSPSGKYRHRICERSPKTPRNNFQVNSSDMRFPIIKSAFHREPQLLGSGML